MRKLKKILIITGITLVSLFLILVLLIKIFEDDIKKYAVNQLNKNLNAPVNVDEIEFSIWSKFPYASLEFKNVTINDAYVGGTTTDTLLHAKKIFLEFNVWDVVGGDYSVKEIEAEDAIVNIRINEDGQENFNIWKEDDSEEDEGDGKFEFNLSKLHLERVDINYINETTEQDYSFYTSDLKMKGNFNQDEFILKGGSDLFINHFVNENVNLVNQKDARLDVDLNIDSNSDTYTLTQGDLRIANLNFDITGAISAQDSGTVCNLDIVGDKIDVESMLTSFSKKVFENIEDYDSKGILDFKANIGGTITATQGPEITAAFHLENGTITQKSNNVSLQEVNLKGNYTNNNTHGIDELILEELSVKLNEGKVHGNLAFEDFKNPKVNLDLKGNLDLKKVQQFAKIEAVDKLTGSLFFNTQINAGVKNVARFNSKNIKINKISGALEVKNGLVEPAETEQIYKNINGKFVLRKNDAGIKGLSLSKGETTIKLDGAFKNLIPFILYENEKLGIVANLESDKIDLKDFISDEEEVVTLAEETTSGINLPDNINFNFQTKIKTLSYGKFQAGNISGKLILLDKIIHAKNVKLNTSEGKVYTTLKLDGTKPGVFYLTSNSTANNVNIGKLFTSFNDFGQTMLNEQNLKGSITTDVSFASLLDKDLNFDTESIIALADIKVTNGELVKMSAMTDIVTYLREYKIADKFFSKHLDDLEKRLSHIKFSEMTNKIKVANEVIEIPSMVVKSSVLDMDLGGTHTFSDTMDYSMSFKFKDLKVKEEEYSEFGRIVDDGSGIKIFMRMFGTTSDPQFEVDKDEKKKTKQEEWQEEKQEFKSILKENFGLFKKDTTLKVRESKKEEVEFIIYEDELDEAEESATQNNNKEKLRNKDNKMRSNKFFNKLIKNKNEEETESAEFEFEEEGEDL